MHAVHGLLGQFVPALPMTREEIESYGLSFRDEFLKPYIHEYFLGQMFGPHTDYVKQTFIEPTDTWEIYRMRPEFDTQRKVEAYFAGKTDEDSIWIRDGLYALISDVLFVPDRNDPYKYHPRIGVQHDYIYRSLNDWEKAAFNRLYDQYYYHRHNEFWREQAMNKLPQLTQSTRMLVCGEDLGMIPGCVAWVMNDLRILSLEIQRMPKDPAQEFGHPDWYPYRSVCTISTHDMSTLRGWWEEDFPADTTLLQHDARTLRCRSCRCHALNFAKRLYASTCKAIPYLPSSPCRTGCRWMANGATPMRRKNVSMYLPIRATTGAGVCT